MTAAIWLLFYLLVTFLIGRAYAFFLGWSAVRVLFYPGILVASLGRQLACIVTGQKGKDIDTTREHGPVGAQAPEGTTSFRAAFALAPFFAAIITFLLIDWLLDHPLSFHARLPRIALEQEAGATLRDVTVDYVSGFASAIGAHELGDWRAWVYLYAGFALIVGSAPSLDDAKAVAVALGSVGLVLMGLAALSVNVFASIAGSIWVGFSTFVALALFVLVASVVLFLPVKFLRDAKKKDGK